MSMHYEATNGTVPKQLADIFVRRAEGGAGYVVIDAVTVDHKYWYIGKTTALDKDSLVPQFKRFATRVKRCRKRAIPDHSPGSGIYLRYERYYSDRTIYKYKCKW